MSQEFDNVEKELESVVTEVTTSKKPEDIKQLERVRIGELLWNSRSELVSNYRKLINHTGGVLSTSMTIAYAKGLTDALNLIIKEK